MAMNDAVTLLKGFNNSIYWLNVLVATGNITESIAGYIIITYKI